MNIQAITFDLDNTLWETDVSILNAERVMQAHLRNIAPAAWMADFSLEAFRAVRQSVIEAAPDSAHDLTRVRRQTIVRWFEQQGADRNHAKQLGDEGFRVFYEARQQVDPYPRVEETLKHLSARFPLAAITNGNADLMAMPLGQYFEFSLQASDFPNAKPHPVMFEAATRQLNVSPEACLHVGDDPDHDITGARNAGFKTAWVNTRQLSPEMGEHADLTVTQIHELLHHL
jgi:putative hydrolase of the HAD superfamily